ncbi:hypothetical protein BASA61_007385 [Batrachochytrium salamandrivorans]|nr:hypothetical protein BASA61_007385 [Batrachochytrium salamandrivorans]
MSRRPEESSTFGALCAGTEVSRFRASQAAAPALRNSGWRSTSCWWVGRLLTASAKSGVLRGLVRLPVWLDGSQSSLSRLTVDAADLPFAKDFLQVGCCLLLESESVAQSIHLGLLSSNLLTKVFTPPTDRPGVVGWHREPFSVSHEQIDRCQSIACEQILPRRQGGVVSEEVSRPSSPEKISPSSRIR